MSTEENLEWWAAVDNALSVGTKLTNNTDELNTAMEHIVRLLLDSSMLLESGSNATSAFLAITALEETAKVHVGMFRSAMEQAPRHRDPLFDHKKKHLLAAAPTIAMGGRLGKAIGQARVVELTNMAKAGELIKLREAALYINRRGEKLEIPSDFVSKGRARELLLFAVEAFDDALVGYTNRSFEFGISTDAIFEHWAKNA